MSIFPGKILLLIYFIGFFFFSCKKEEIKMGIWNSFISKNNITNYPFQNHITDNYVKAFETHKKLSQHHLRNNEWEFLGPDNVAGRILSLAINPKDTNALWAGSSSAGLWYSESGGRGQKAWKNISLGFPVLAISSIAIDPINPDIMYIGTGESYSYNNTDGGRHNRLMRGFWGVGILKSIDAGKTWKMSFNANAQPYLCFWKIVVNPNNTKIIYAAGTHGIYKSSDEGETWKLILNKKMSCELVMHPNIPEILIAGVGGLGGDDFGIFMSQDGGSLWKKITDGEIPNGQGRIMITINKKFPQKVFALISDSFKTKSLIRTNNLFTDFAISSIVNVSSYQGWYAKGMISNGTGKEVMIGGVDLFLDNSGNYNNFIRFHMGEIGLHADFHDMIANPLDDNKIYFATDGGIFRTDDFGRTFYSCNSGLNTSQFYSGSFTKNGEFGIGGMQDNRSATFTGTTSWELTHYGDGVASAINFSNPNIAFCCSQNLLLSRSTDKTQNWKTLLIDESACFATPFKMSPSNENVLYTASNILYKSEDNGVSKFNKIISPPDSAYINSIEVSVKNSDFLIFSTLPTDRIRPSLYKSSDGGKTISNITGNLPDRIISDISIINTNEYIITLSGFATFHVYSTKDGGLTWNYIDRKLPDIPIHTIWTSPFHPNLIYIGSDLGLYYTKDSGKNWFKRSPSSFDAIPVYDLFYTEEDFKLIVFTHSRGVFKIDPFEVITSTSNPQVINKRSCYVSSQLPITIRESEGFLISLSGQKTEILKQQLLDVLRSLPYGIYYFSTGNEMFKILHFQ